MRRTISNMAYLFKNMWRYNKNLFIITLILVPMGILPSFIGIYLPKQIIDSVQNGADVWNFGMSIMPLLAVLLINMLLMHNLNESMTIHKIQYRMGYINRLMFKALTTDYENIDGEEGQKKYGNANQALNRNDAATEKIALVVQKFFTNVFGLVLYGGIVTVLNPILLMVLAVVSAVHFALGKWKNQSVNSRHEAKASVGRKLNYITNTSSDFKQMKDLKLYQMKDWFNVNYGIWLERMMSIEFKNNRVRWFVEVVDGLMLIVRDGVAYGYLIYSVINENMTLGNFAFYFGAITGLSVWIFGLVKNITEFDEMSKETEHLRNYFEMQDRVRVIDREKIEPHLTAACEIKFENVHYLYEGSEVETIRGIDLTIQKGEKIALVGLNGAGKTTMVKLLTGLYRPTKGEIYINGVPTSNFDKDDYFKLFSVVFQDNYVLPMAIEENIALKASPLITVSERNKINQICEQVGIARKVKRLPKGLQTRLVKSIFDDAVELSGGELQKLMMAQALYKESPILVLDEPTAALDPISEKEIYTQYHDMTHQSTSIFISHRLASTRFCDRILLMDRGKIIEEGTHESLMTFDSFYKEMYDKQSHYYKEEVVLC